MDGQIAGSGYKPSPLDITNCPSCGTKVLAVEIGNHLKRCKKALMERPGSPGPKRDPRKTVLRVQTKKAEKNNWRRGRCWTCNADIIFVKGHNGRWIPYEESPFQQHFCGKDAYDRPSWIRKSAFVPKDAKYKKPIR